MRLSKNQHALLRFIVGKGGEVGIGEINDWVLSNIYKGDWFAHGALHNFVRRMKKTGLIERRSLKIGYPGVRNRYYITDLGREMFNYMKARKGK